MAEAALNESGVGIFARSEGVDGKDGDADSALFKQHSGATGRPRLLTWKEKAGRSEGGEGYEFGDLSASIFRLFQTAASLFVNRPTLLLGVIEAEGIGSLSNCYVTVVPLSYKGLEVREEKWYSGVFQGVPDGCPKWDEVTVIGQRKNLNEVSSVLLKIKVRRPWQKAKSLGEIKLPMAVWWEDQCADKWFELCPRRGQKRAVGRIRLRLQRFGWEEKVKVDPDRILRRFSMLSPLILVEAVLIRGLKDAKRVAPVLTLVLLDENGEEIKGTKQYSNSVAKTTRLNSFRINRLLNSTQNLSDATSEDARLEELAKSDGENVHVYEQVFIFGDASDLFSSRSFLIKVKDSASKSILNFQKAGNLGEVRVPLEEVISNGDRKQSAAFYGIQPRLNRKAHANYESDLLLRWYCQGSMQIQASLGSLLDHRSQQQSSAPTTQVPPSQTAPPTWLLSQSRETFSTRQT